MRIVPLFALLAGCASEAEWRATVAFHADAGLGGCAVGDVSSHWPGDEIVATATDGVVHVVGHPAGAWQATVAAELPGEMIQVAVGDARPDLPGLEIVAVGMARGPEDSAKPGAAYVIWFESGEWRREKIIDDGRLLHGVCVADIDADVPGAEVYVTGFEHKVYQVVRENGLWRVRAWARISGPGKCATPFRGGVAIGSADGAIHLCRAHGGELRVETILRAGSGVARLGADGDALLFCCDDGTLRLLDGADEPVILHREDDRLRGAVLGDLDPTRPGREAVTAGYTHRLTVLASAPGGWHPVFVHQDSDTLHHVAKGEFDGDPATAEIVAVGFSGNVTVLRLAGRPR